MNTERPRNPTIVFHHGARWVGLAGILLSIPLIAGCEPCDPGVDCGDADAVNPTIVTVEVSGAVIGPGKFNHTSWDASGGTIPDQVWTDLSTALVALDPFVAILPLLADPVLAGTMAPDPYGTVRLDVGATVGTVYPPAGPDTNMEDTYTPTFQSIIWTGVPLDQDVRIRVDLTDEDILNADTIGVAEINSDDLRTALAAKKIYHVPVADQTNSQLLFVTISVRE